MRRNYLALSILCAAFFTSCEQDIDFQYTPRTLSNVDFEVCETQECPTIDVRYISFTQPESIIRSVDQWIETSISKTLLENTTPQQSINDAITRYITNSQNGYPETTEYSAAHEFTADFAVSYASNKVVSLVYYSYLFDGGAHGFDKTVYVNFDPKKGVRYGSERLVTEEFSVFAKAEFQRNYPNIPFEIDSQSFTEESPYQLGFTENGIILLYTDEYAIPISDENYELIIPWNIAEEYLTF